MYIKFSYLTVLSILLISITPNQSLCFNSDEHSLLSNSAFLLSLSYSEKKGLINKTEVALIKECFLSGDKQMNFGYLSESVDYMLDPSKYFKLYGPSATICNEGDKANSCRGVYCEKAKDLLDSEKILWKDKLLAYKYNTDHFQGKILTKYHEYQDLAQLQAAKGNLAFALVLCAFATHYLEDFFAPGHVLTYRTAVNNISAIAIHNTKNKNGAQVYVAGESLTDYLDLFNDIKDNHRARPDQLKDIDGSNLTPGKGVEALKSLKNNQPLTIYGDNELEKTLGQKELIICQVAKSITAIFNAYKTLQISNLNSNYDDSKDIKAVFDSITYVAVESSVWHPYKVIEITPYLATPLTEDSNPRVGLEVDYAIFSKLSDYLNLNDDRPLYRYFDYGLGLGYDISCNAVDRNSFSHGPLIKYTFDIKNTDISFSFNMKYLFNDENSKTRESLSSGFRISLSRDFFSIFIGYGTEYPDIGEDETYSAIYTGLTFYIPRGAL